MLHGLPLHGLGIARLCRHGMEVLRLFFLFHGFSLKVLPRHPSLVSGVIVYLSPPKADERGIEVSITYFV